MSDSLRVWWLPSWYPTAENPLRGSFFLEQAQMLQDAGVEMTVLYPELQPLSQWRKRGLHALQGRIVHQIEDGLPTWRLLGLMPIPQRYSEPYARYWVRAELQLLRRVLRHAPPPDLVHVQVALWAGVATAQAKQRYHLPYVITEHSSAYARGLIQKWQQPYLSHAFGAADGVAAVSGALAQQLQPYLNAAQSVYLIPNPVDTDFFSLPSFFERTGADPFTFLTVAHLNENKGIDVLVRAFARAFGRADEVLLQIGGDGPIRPQIESLADQLGIRSRVAFLGRLTRQQVRDAMQAADAFVLPSFVETFGVVLIEALSCGLPLIATRSGGPEEIVTPENGLLVDPGNEGKLADALLQMWRQADRYSKVELHQQAEQRFSTQHYVHQVLGWYDRVLAQEKDSSTL